MVGFFSCECRGAHLCCRFLSIFVGLSLLFKTTTSPPTAYTSPGPFGDVQRVRPVALLPWQLQQTKYMIAVAPTDNTPALNAEVDSLISFISANYPPANFSNIGGIGIGPAGSYVRGIYVPPLSSVVRRFTDEASLESYVRDPGYGTRSLSNGTRIFAAIVLSSARPRLAYSIRLNSSEVPSTSQDPVSITALASDTSNVLKYLDSRMETSGPPFANNNGANALEKAPRPGFLTLQLLVDRWAIGFRAAGLPDAAALMTTFQAALAFQTGGNVDLAGLSSWLGALSPDNATAVASGVVSWIGASESFAPQTVDLAPFPTPQLTVNPYTSVMIYVFDIIFILGILLPSK